MTSKNGRNDSKNLEVSRRDVMKAAGGAVVAGGLASATVTAQQGGWHCVEDCGGTRVKENEKTAEGVSFSPGDEQGENTDTCGTYTFDLSTWEGYHYEIYVKGGGGSGPQACTLQASGQLCPSDSETEMSVTVCQSDYSHSEVCLTEGTCPDDDDGGEGDPVFTGCSQVCNVEDPNDVNVVDQDCNSVDPSVALKEGGKGEGCWEIVSGQYKIIGAEGVDNPNQCAQSCLN